MKILLKYCFEILARLTPAQFKYIEELQRFGKVEKHYHLIGQQGHVPIVEAPSDDELSKIVSEDPLFFLARGGFIL